MKPVLIIMPSFTRRKIARTIHQYHTIAIANQQLESEIETTQTLWNGEVLRTVKADEEIQWQVNKWIDYAEEAIAEANRSTRKHVHWAKFVNIQLFSDNDEIESVSDCKNDKEEHYSFHKHLATWPENPPLSDPAEEQSANQLSTPLLLRNIQAIAVDNEDSSSDSSAEHGSTRGQHTATRTRTHQTRHPCLGLG